jgi:endogenous inhibitor of DNA gyrase (YacG/DUF329 family)
VIDHARASIAFIDERLARINAERESLALLRDAWHHYIALQDGLVAVTDQPEQGLGPAQAHAPAAIPSPPGDGSPATHQPGSARVGQRERRQRGRRAPATMAAPSTSSSDPVGTPAPASYTCSCGRSFSRPQGLGRHRRWEGHDLAEVQAAMVDCPDCGEQVRANGLGSHQRKHKPGYTPAVQPTPAGTLATCPECEKEVKAMGLGTHRRQAHGIGRPTLLVQPEKSPEPEPPREPWVPTPVGTGASDGPEVRNGKQRWLCNRCRAEFLDRAKRDEHAATHPADDPGITVGRDPFARRQIGAGVPIA